MAVNQTVQGYTLPCGRDVEQVWERLDDVEAGRADAHDIDCPHCRAARESLTVRREVTGELAAEDVRPSVDLTGRIMSAVRAEVRRRDMLALPTTEPGEVRVSEQAVAAVLRFAADTVDVAASTVDGVVDAKLILKRRRVTAKVTTRRTSTDGLADAARAAIEHRLGQIAPVVHPAVTIKVHAARSAS